MAAIKALIELLDADGQVRQSFAVNRLPVRLGRALANDVVLDDPHVAPFHVTLDGALSWAEGGLKLVVGSTVNGVQLGGSPGTQSSLAAGASRELKAGEVWRLGNTRLRVRLADEVVPDEVPLPAQQRDWKPAALLSVALLAWVSADKWLSVDPGGDPMDFFKAALEWVLLGTTWCGMWALGSTLFQRRFAFLTHLRIFAGLLLLGSVLDSVVSQVGFMFSWPWLSQLGQGLIPVLMAYMVWRHLVELRPQRRLSLALGCTLAFTVGTGVNLHMHHKQTDRWFSQLYASTLSLPALRLAAAQPVEAMMEDLRPLEARLAELAHDDDEDHDTAGEAASAAP